MDKLKNVLKTGDIILIALLSLSIVFSFSLLRLSSTQGQLVSISVNGREVYRFSLSQNRSFTVQGPLGKTLIQIENNKVWVASAPCPQKICMKMGKISKPGEIIVCIPNKVFIKIEGKGKQNLDGITM